MASLTMRQKQIKKLKKATLLHSYLCMSLYVLTIKQNERRERKWWVKPWITRKNKSTLSLLHNELQTEDPDEYRNFIRMNENTFNFLLSLIQNQIEKQNTVMRESISARDRLTVTLRFLATGESYKSLSQSTRVSISSISIFVPQVCDAIYESLKEKYLHFPSNPEEWENIAQDFQNDWNVPNTIGSIDGKHIAFRPLRSAGSTFYNYKEFHSVVLLAVVDANYNFIYVDVGINGRVSDGGVLQNSALGYALERNALMFPKDKPLPGMQKPVPYVFLADAAFPLKRNIIKPYPFRNLCYENRIFNYRLSRGRRVVENAFGILANRFRIFLTTIALSHDKVTRITLAACALHNFLKRECSYYRRINENEVETIWGTSIQSQITGNRTAASVTAIREEFKLYFNTVGKVPWQDGSV